MMDRPASLAGSTRRSPRRVRAISIAAGNAGQEKGETPDDFGWIMGRIHGSGHIPRAGLAAELEWTVVGNTIVNISEIGWNLVRRADRFSVHVRPPGATQWISIKAQEFVENRRLSPSALSSRSIMSSITR